ncbi:MAG: glycosyltransferase [Candidatus Treponema excrementipullorum]|nr:glycosyltransferase [Candidatus Treponema excrementipullorum]
MTIFHVTSAHTRYDSRIFSKECVSLVKAGYNVNLIVCDGLGDEIKSGVSIIDAGNFREKARLKRFRESPKAIKKILLQNNPDVIHFHDPELLFIGLFFSRRKVKVIYDSHENVPKQILSKPYIPVFFRKIISLMMSVCENYVVKRLTGVVTVTEELYARFLKINSCVYLVRNFPELSYFPDIDFTKKDNSFVYAGGITQIRGFSQMSEAALKSKVKITMYGPKDSDCVFDNVNSYIEYKGNIRQSELFSVLSHASVGMILFHKVPNHMVCSPNKLFEYMASGMAVIASDIPMWKDIVEKYKCGLCVDPSNAGAIAETMAWCVEHPEEVMVMGKNGMEAVRTVFNWESESKKLINLYSVLSQ